MRRPLNVILDLTSRCNLKCTMCYFSAVDRLEFQPFDRPTGDDGAMPLPVFEHVAGELFPRAWRVALGCAAEPLLHPRFTEVLEIAARHRVPDLWFPTNLLALSPAKAKAIVRHGVRTVAVSIDGVTPETYERIRVGGRWDRLLSRLELLDRTRREEGSGLPRVRLIFTWMQSNRAELAQVPDFAAAHGFSELDVRFVSPTAGVDNTDELLSGEDRAELDAELEATARRAVRLGLRLGSFPELPTRRPARGDVVGRLRNKAFRLRAGLDRAEYRRHHRRELRHGCGYPGVTFLVRPNGAVLPCPFWEGEPIAMVPEAGHDEIAGSPMLRRILDGLESDEPIGTCVSCDQRRDALYRPHRGRPAELTLPVVDSR